MGRTAEAAMILEAKAVGAELVSKNCGGTTSAVFLIPGNPVPGFSPTCKMPQNGVHLASSTFVLNSFSPLAALPSGEKNSKEV
jgi:hypothetical protein